MPGFMGLEILLIIGLVVPKTITAFIPLNHHPTTTLLQPSSQYHRHHQHWPLYASSSASSSDTRGVNLAIVGPPCSGQTTYAQLLVERCGLKSVGISDPGFLDQLRDKGSVMVDLSLFELATEVMVDKCVAMSKESPGGVVIDGWPRAPEQVERLDKEGVVLDKIVYLIPEDEERDDMLDQLQNTMPDRVVEIENNAPLETVFNQILHELGNLVTGGTGSGEVISTPQMLPPSPIPLKKVDDQQAHSPPVTGPPPPVKFGDLTVAGDTALYLKKKGIHSPTAIQERAMGVVKEGKHTLIHAETGSGKTLAYLLPLLQRVQMTAPKQILIITPTRELAVQVASEATGLCQDDATKVTLFVGEPQGDVLGNCQSPIVVGPAKTVYEAMKQANSTTGQLKSTMNPFKALVIDEVDRCFATLSTYATVKEKEQRARHPRPTTLLVQEIYQSLSLTPQLVGASATIGRPLRREIARSMGLDAGTDELVVVREGNAEGEDASRSVTIPPGIAHDYLQIKEPTLDSMLLAVRACVEVRGARCPLIFIPPTSSLTETVSTLRKVFKQAGKTIMPLHEAYGFVSGKGEVTADLLLKRHNELSKTFKEMRDGKGRNDLVLVTSMDTARGLDLTGVDQVFLLGRVKSVDEYQHVAGRTGRRGTQGRVTSILGAEDVKKLKGWESMLGVTFDDAGPYMWAAVSKKKGASGGEQSPPPPPRAGGRKGPRGRTP